MPCSNRCCSCCLDLSSTHQPFELPFSKPKALMRQLPDQGITAKPAQTHNAQSSVLDEQHSAQGYLSTATGVIGYAARCAGCAFSSCSKFADCCTGLRHEALLSALTNETRF